MFSFPNPVNEKAARVVAGVVAITGVVILLTGWHWLLVVLAYGFWARVLTGPTLSPLGRLAMRVVAPRLGPPKHVGGAPGRLPAGVGGAEVRGGAAEALRAGHRGGADERRRRARARLRARHGRRCPDGDARG